MGRRKEAGEWGAAKGESKAVSEKSVGKRRRESMKRGGESGEGGGGEWGKKRGESGEERKEENWGEWERENGESGGKEREEAVSGGEGEWHICVIIGICLLC